MAVVSDAPSSYSQNATVGTVPPPSGVGMTPPTTNIGMTPPPASVGMTPPPMGAPGSTPPPMNGEGMAPPPMGGIGMAPPSTSSAPERPARNQAKGRGKKGIVHKLSLVIKSCRLKSIAMYSPMSLNT